MKRVSAAINRVPRELKLFFAMTLALGIGASMMDSTLNNFLNDRFALTGLQRSVLEFPRELPGFLTAFAAALLWFLCSRRLGAVSMLFCALGAALIGFVSRTYFVMLAWLFLYSLGQHLFIPLSSSIGMELAREGREGRRLGQLNAARNFAAIGGSFIVFVGFKFLGFSFHHTFLLATAAFLTAAVIMFTMKPKKGQSARVYLTLRREYTLYYVLSILYGSRKQIFMTFAPWVLVTVFHQPTQTIATLLTIGGIIGLFFQPLLGYTTDRLGERFVLASEAFLLIFVCAGYALGRSLLTEKTAFLVACVCFVLDQMLMSVNMARATYIKKMAIDPAHVQPALTTSVTIDHAFSITVAIVGGLIWNSLGFEYVFLLGAFIAVANLVAALRIRIPARAIRSAESAQLPVSSVVD
jgi:predicted MFS family arabinose efflux permease